jgi:hypothetical protein
MRSRSPLAASPAIYTSTEARISAAFAADRSIAPRGDIMNDESLFLVLFFLTVVVSFKASSQAELPASSPERTQTTACRDPQQQAKGLDRSPVCAANIAVNTTQ